MIVIGRHNNSGPAVRPHWITTVRAMVLFGLLVASSPVDAGEVELKNGDRLSGEIVKMEDDILTLKTAYAGDMAIKWSEIARVRSDKPMTVLIHGEPGGTLRDFFSGGAELVEVTEITETSPIPLSNIRAINLGPIRYRGNLTIGGNSTHGNTETQAVNAAMRIVIRAHRQRLFGEAKYNYGEANQAVTARNSLANAKYDYFISKKVFLNASGLLEKDTFQQLNLRSTLGAGVGYQFLERARTTLSADIGLAYVNEHFTTAPSTSTPSSRWSLRFERALLPDRLSVFHKHDAFYDLRHGNALRILADQGVRITVYHGLFINLEYDLRLNTQPAPGRKKVDEAFIFGIGYQFD